MCRIACPLCWSGLRWRDASRPGRSEGVCVAGCNGGRGVIEVDTQRAVTSDERERGMWRKDVRMLERLPRVGPEIARGLWDAGYRCWGDVDLASDEELLAISGIGYAVLVAIRDFFRFEVED